MRSGRLALATLLLSLGAVVWGASAAWAGTVTEQYTGWSWVTQPTEGGQATGVYARPVSLAGDVQAFARVMCGAADGSGAATALGVTTTSGPWSASSTAGTSLCTSPQVVWSVTVYVQSLRGTSTVLRWKSNLSPETGTWNAATVVPSPSPSPSPLYFPSPWASPDVVATAYVYPTPPSGGGGGDVDSCASQTCTVTIAAGSSVGLNDWQMLALCGFAGLLLVLSLVRFWRTEGGALRV